MPAGAATWRTKAVPDHSSAASGVLRRPFREQVAFLRQKLGRQVPTRAWDDLDRAEHDRAFMVAGATKAELLSDLAAAVDRAIAEGKSLDAFRKDFDAAVKTNGWQGWTGSGSKGGRAWRTRTIYRTNASTSYAAGRYAQLKAGGYPLWVYRHGGSREPRFEHLKLDGLVLPADHPFWATWYPPSDWGCSCYVLGARSLAGAIRLGGRPELKLPGWWNAPEPETGLPPGIGKGWDYPPGASVAETVSTMAGKLGGWDHRIAKAFLEEMPAAIADRLAESYRALPSVADDVRRFARRVLGGTEGTVEAARTLGPATSARAAEIGRTLDQAVDRFDFAIDRSAVNHVFASHGDAAVEAARGQIAIGDDAWALLPRIVARGVIEEADEPSRFLLRYRLGSIEYVTVWEARSKRRSLALVTMRAHRI